MTRDEYLAVLATEPATGTQVGAILGEFARLSVADRAERLAITAGLLGLEELGSTSDLVMGDAGRLIAMLRRTRDRGELPDVAAAAVDEDQADEPDSDVAETRISIADALQCIALMIYLAFTGKGNAGESGNVALHIDRLGARGSFPCSSADTEGANLLGPRC